MNIMELENFTIRIAQVTEKINSVRKNIETKSSICTDQLDAWAQEKATLLMERQQLNNEILKSSKLAEEAIAQQLTSTLEDQICKERSYNERGLTNIKKRLSDFQEQASANVNHISNLSSELNQVKEARTKSEASKENLIRELETRQTELQAIEDVIISTNKETRIQNEALDKQIKNNLKNSDKMFADNVKIKKKLSSLGARSKSKNSLKEKKSKKLVVNDPQSPVLGSDAESQIKSPRLLIKKDKKQVQFALPEIASPRRSHAPPPAPPPAPPRAPSPRKLWEFSDSSDDGIAAQHPLPRKFAVPTTPSSPRYTRPRSLFSGPATTRATLGPPPPPQSSPLDTQPWSLFSGPAERVAAPPRATPLLPPPSSPRESNSRSEPLRASPPPSPPPPEWESPATYKFFDKEPPTKEHPLLQASQLPPPPPPHRQNKFFSSRQPKRYKSSEDKKYGRKF